MNRPNFLDVAMAASNSEQTFLREPAIVCLGLEADSPMGALSKHKSRPSCLSNRRWTTTGDLRRWAFSFTNSY